MGPQRIEELRTDRDKPALVELRSAYSQHGARQIDVGQGELECLLQPQTGSVKEQEQRAERVRIQLERVAAADVYRVKEAPQLVTGVHVPGRRRRGLRLLLRRRQGRAVRESTADRIAIESGQCVVLPGSV